MPASSFQQQKLRVCEVCSAYLGLHDNDRRLADHFGGKLHLGFIEIREKLEELRVNHSLFCAVFLCVCMCVVLPDYLPGNLNDGVFLSHVGFGYFGGLEDFFERWSRIT